MAGKFKHTYGMAYMYPLHVELKLAESNFQGVKNEGKWNSA